jgi:hypothetical protein
MGDCNCGHDEDEHRLFIAGGGCRECECDEFKPWPDFDNYIGILGKKSMVLSCDACGCLVLADFWRVHPCNVKGGET